MPWRDMNDPEGREYTAAEVVDDILEDEEQEGKMRALFAEGFKEAWLSEDLGKAEESLAMFHGAHGRLHSMMDQVQEQAAQFLRDGDLEETETGMDLLKEFEALHFAVEHFELLLRDHVRHLRSPKSTPAVAVPSAADLEAFFYADSGEAEAQ